MGRFPAGLFLEVQDQPALAPVEDPKGRMAAGRITAERLDFDNLGSLLGQEHGCVGAGDVSAEIQDGESGQGLLHVASPPRCTWAPAARPAGPRTPLLVGLVLVRPIIRRPLGAGKIGTGRPYPGIRQAGRLWT